jgi:peptidoglycan/xylan/chitin deacetylase (PgdA/CDA1 family)
MSRLRSLWKSVAEMALMPVSRAALRGQARSGGVAILAYHNVVAPGTGRWGDLSLHLPLDSFRSQIDRLQRTHRVVPLSELRAGQGSGAPRAAITFDDAYRGSLRLALPELASRGLPVTVFVPPGQLGAPGFWWDLQAGADGLAPDVRRNGLEREAGRPRVAGQAPHPDLQPATAAELDEAVSLPGVTVASHSWSHPNLTALSAEDLDDELRRPREWLLARFPHRTLREHLSFPYGLWNQRVVEAAERAGYSYLYRVNGGVAPALSSGGHTLVPRINVPSGVGDRGFDLLKAGLRR